MLFIATAFCSFLLVFLIIFIPERYCAAVCTTGLTWLHCSPTSATNLHICVIYFCSFFQTSANTFKPQSKSYSQLKNRQNIEKGWLITGTTVETIAGLKAGEASYCVFRFFFLFFLEYIFILFCQNMHAAMETQCACCKQCCSRRMGAILLLVLIYKSRNKDLLFFLFSAPRIPSTVNHLIVF